MRLVLHPQVYSDIDKVMEYYEATATAQLADDFYVELRSVMVEAAKRPESFSIHRSSVSFGGLPHEHRVRHSWASEPRSAQRQTPISDTKQNDQNRS